MGVYQQILNSRYDLTSWLIHFTRDISSRNMAFENLKSIITSGSILPSWSMRSGKRTIYGPHPAVCFTEQPLWAFCQYVRQRNDPSRISGYGLLVSKHDVIANGGLPVIYGIDDHTEQSSNSKERLLDAGSLPLNEQYRYVAFNPNRGTIPVDWSHEREWRWSFRQYQGIHAGYPLCNGTRVSDKSTPNDDIHFFVSKDSEVNILRDLITALPLIHANCFVESWYKKAKSKSRIISLQTVTANLNTNIEYGKLETIIEKALWNS